MKILYTYENILSIGIIAYIFLREKRCVDGILQNIEAPAKNVAGAKCVVAIEGKIIA